MLWYDVTVIYSEHWQTHRRNAEPPEFGICAKCECSTRHRCGFCNECFENTDEFVPESLSNPE